MAAHDTPVSDNNTRKTMTIQSVVCILCNAQRCIACEACCARAADYYDCCVRPLVACSSMCVRADYGMSLQRAT
jgi:hypothetical protein